MIKIFLGVNMFDWEAKKNMRVRDKVAKLHTNCLNKDKWWWSMVYAYHVMMPVMHAILSTGKEVENMKKCG